MINKKLKTLLNKYDPDAIILKAQLLEPEDSSERAEWDISLLADDEPLSYYSSLRALKTKLSSDGSQVNIIDDIPKSSPIILFWYF